MIKRGVRWGGNLKKLSREQMYLDVVMQLALAARVHLSNISFDSVNILCECCHQTQPLKRHTEEVRASIQLDTDQH